MTSPLHNPDFVYKIAARAPFEASRAKGEFPRMPIDDQDGYIHFSTAAQLADTLRLYFAGQSDVVIIAVATKDLGDGLRWEPSRGGQLFPHHYGALPTSAIGQTAIIAVAVDGTVDLPEWVR